MVAIVFNLSSAFLVYICSIRVLGCNLGGFFSFVIAGINHVIQQARQTGRRSVISMSLIGPKTEAVNVAIREAVANNVVVITAAGKPLRNILRCMLVFVQVFMIINNVLPATTVIS